jgi:hypothetical protein
MMTLTFSLEGLFDSSFVFKNITGKAQTRHFFSAEIKESGRGSLGGLAPAQVPVNVLTPSTGRTERFTFRPVAGYFTGRQSFSQLWVNKRSFSLKKFAKT